MLQVIGIADSRGHAATWAIESPTPGVVLVNVDVGGNKSSAPLHWRAGDWTKPPLDIEINPSDGTVQAIQFVLQDERARVTSVREISEWKDGTPVVNTAGWPDDRYRDVRCSMKAVRSPTDELVVSLGSRIFVTTTRVSGGMTFCWDDSARLCEIRLGSLTAEEWDVINAFSGDVDGP